MSDKLLGGLYGALIGDAVGVPYEFKNSMQIPRPPTMVPPNNFNRTYLGVPPGTWSDDGSLLLCLCEALLESGNWLDTDWVHSFGGKLAQWRYQGYMTPDNKKFDIGNQTSEAIHLLEFGLDPLDLEYDADTNGNGGLMRALPVALLMDSSDPDYICAVSDMHSMLTHGHPISLICCQIYTFTAISLLRGETFQEAFWGAIDLIEARCKGTEWQEHFATVLAGNDAEPRGTGYVVDTLWSARFAVVQSQLGGKPSYRDTIERAILLGNDTDTTACVAGGWAGIIYGLSGIPQEWRDGLRGKHLFAKIELVLDAH